MSWALALLVLLVLAQSSAAAQTGSAPAPALDSAAITGVVVDAHTRMPIRSVVVLLSPPYGRSAGQTATTDAAGRFEFTRLSGGEYLLSASRPGYLPTRFGERRLGGPGTPIVVSDGETRSDIAILMSPGGVISGRVVDAQGERVAGVQVFAMHYVFESGQRELRPAFADRTDDRGDFRLFTLPPGEYYVYAEPGAAPIIAPPSTLATLPTLGPAFGSASGTYYPNSSTPARARTVTVVGGREIAGVNIALATGKPARVRGRIITSGGEPFARARISLRRLPAGVLPVSVYSVVREDGSFEVPGVPPGGYLLTVRGNEGEPHAESALVEIAVTGEDIDDLVVITGRAGTLRGTMTTDEGEPVPIAAQQLFVQLVPSSEMRGAAPSRTMVNPDYTFELKDLSGVYRLTLDVTGSASLWAVKAVRWRGEDITHRAFDFRNGEVIEGVEVVLSERWATISGVIRDEQNAPVGDNALLLFPADEALWFRGSRYIRPMRTDQQGRYGVSWLFPGDYLLAVTNEIDMRQWDDVSFLRSLVERAARVTLAEQDDLVFDVRIKRAP